jgi:hypothetical protein
MNALFWSTALAMIGPKDGDYTWIATPAGSSVDFYVETMFSCVNDYDIMYHSNDRIAVPHGYPVPRSLPAEFHCQVKVFELINTDFPCYVLVKHVGYLVKRKDNDNYEYCLNPEDCCDYFSIYQFDFLKSITSITSGTDLRFNCLSCISK